MAPQSACHCSTGRLAGRRAKGRGRVRGCAVDPERRARTARQCCRKLVRMSCPGSNRSRSAVGDGPLRLPRRLLSRAQPAVGGDIGTSACHLGKHHRERPLITTRSSHLPMPWHGDLRRVPALNDDRSQTPRVRVFSSRLRSGRPMARQLRMAKSIMRRSSRSCPRLVAILSPAECGRLRQIGLEIAHALKASATAVEQGDSPRVHTIAANASREA